MKSYHLKQMYYLLFSIYCGVVLLLRMDSSLKAGLIIGLLRPLDMTVHYQSGKVHHQSASKLHRGF
jgi:hypothetical protein